MHTHLPNSLYSVLNSGLIVFIHHNPSSSIFYSPLEMWSKEQLHNFCKAMEPGSGRGRIRTPIGLTLTLAPGSFPGNLLGKKPMEERGTEFARAAPAHKGREEGEGRTPQLHRSACHRREQGNGDDGTSWGSVGGRLSVQASSTQEECSLLRHQLWKRRKHPLTQGSGQCPSCWGHRPCWDTAPPEKREASLGRPGEFRANSLTSVSKNYQTWSNHIPSLQLI